MSSSSMSSNLKPVLLLVDDDIALRKSFSTILKSEYSVIEANGYESAIKALGKNTVDVAVLDIDYDGDKNGVDLLKQIKKLKSELPIIMFSSISDISKVVQCIKLGANDYVVKTAIDVEQALKLRVKSVLENSMLKKNIEALKRSSNQHLVVTNSPIIQNILTEIESIGEMNILLEGETGVGKTPIAYYANACLTTNGERPFVRVNCAGLARERLQDELFGHKKGAFTGADTDRTGLVDLARGGDLFLDEVGELTPECQAELLIFMDTGEYRSLGDSNVKYANCRVISATNRDLEDEVYKGKFRKDLYSRLAQCKFIIPPLRDRREDVIAITKFYIEKLCGFAKDCTQEVWTFLNAQSWSEGNVRELRDTIRYMCNKSRDCAKIEMQHVNPKRWNINQRKISVKTPQVESDDFVDHHKVKDNVFNLGYEEYVQQIEKLVLERMATEEKSVRDLAKKAKVNNSKLRRKLKQHNISVNGKKPGKRKQLILFG